MPTAPAQVQSTASLPIIPVFSLSRLRDNKRRIVMQVGFAGKKLLPQSRPTNCSGNLPATCQ